MRRSQMAEWRRESDRVETLAMLPWKPVLCALLVGLAPFAVVAADEHVVAPRGEYARIDVTLANETIAALTTGTEAEKGRAIQAVEAAPQKYAPPVLYVLSSALFARDRKDDAAFWFYAGQLRGRFDA